MEQLLLYIVVEESITDCFMIRNIFWVVQVRVALMLDYTCIDTWLSLTDFFFKLMISSSIHMKGFIGGAGSRLV